MHSSSNREKKTDIVRKRTGCHNCRSRRRKCDEGLPECQACVQRGLQCGGYARPFTFKDVSELAAASSRRSEAARWAALHREDARRERQRTLKAQATSKTTAGLECRMANEVPMTSMELRGITNPATLMTTITDDQQLRSQGAHSQSSCAQLNTAAANHYKYTQPMYEPAGQDTGAIAALSHLTPQSDQVAIGHDAYIGADYFEESSLNDPLLALISDDVGHQSQIQNALTRHEGSGNETQDIADWRSMGQLLPEPSRNAVLADPAADCVMATSLEEALVHNFEQRVMPTLPVHLSFPGLFSESPCFRAAVLALSASNVRLAQRLSPVQFRNKDAEKFDWFYYDQAVRHVNQQLGQVQKPDDESLAVATLLLAYHELDIGSPLGARNHVRGLDAIASNLRLAASSMPALFKAWRMLRQDVKSLAMSTRQSAYPTDAYEIYNALDSQLAIRDILGELWKLHSRHTIESTFAAGDLHENMESPSERAGQWLRSVLQRNCDERQFQERDYHATCLNPDDIMDMCDLYSRKLDEWHRTLDPEDLPVPQLGTSNGFVSWPSFESFMTYKFPNERKALDYVMYCVARMLCNHLRSVIDGSTHPLASDNWARVILGIVYHVDVCRQRFSTFRFESLLLMTAYLSEGADISLAIRDGLMPRMLRNAFGSFDMSTLTYLKAWLKLIVTEKSRGKTIRYMIASLEEHREQWQGLTTHKVAAFGDYNGKGGFQECYVVECS